MKNPIQKYWQLRLKYVKESLESNGFDAFVAETVESARQLVKDKILFNLNGIKTISKGDSLTVESAGLLEEIKKNKSLEFLDPFEESFSDEEKYERGRQALLSDLFFTGTNALTESGILVNLDGWGNRVAALTYGPRYVIVLAGRNKIVSDIDAAMFRIKNYAAPINAIRFNKKTPCVETSFCGNCKGSNSICRVWAITEKSYPKGRIKVILVNKDLGF